MNKQEAMQPIIGREQIHRAQVILNRYKEGKANLERRVVDNEQWYKLRHWECMRGHGKNQVEPTSGWLFNAIASKHADVMDNFPSPNVLPREEGDQEEAKLLGSILPVVLEQSEFEEVYDEVNDYKLKTGTGIYGVFWDPSGSGGLGDVAIKKVDILNLFWESGITDIQQSANVFHIQLVNNQVLREQYPQLASKFAGPPSEPIGSKYLYDDRVDTENKATVVEVYYHKRGVLHYCKFVGDQVLFATENQTEPQPDADGNVLKAPMAETGLYDHGRYPYEFDPLFPIEGSPCGYGYVDVCRSPQTEIDLRKTSFVRNAQVGATPRFFSRQDGAVNEEEFLNLTKPIVHVAGNLGEDSLRQIPFRGLDGVYVSLLDRTIDELRQTSGNTETSTGNVSAGVTAASAIAALQEASGKGSRDTLRSSYRSFGRIVELCVERIRQFSDLPRKFRILGSFGAEEFVSYDNSRLLPVSQGEAFGQDMGFRKPVFDIRILAQKKNSYTRVTQNELALQLYQLGFFDPNRWAEARECLEMMDFEGKDVLLRRLSENASRAVPMEAGAAW